MNFKTTWTLFGLFFSVLIVMLLTSLFGGNKGAMRKDHALPSLGEVKSADIGTVIVERFRDTDGKPLRDKLAFDRTDTGWRLRQPSARVQDELVEQIIEQARRAKREEASDRLTADLARWGLDRPAVTLTLQQKGGEKEWQLHLGNQSIGGDQAVVYVNSSDQAEPMPVRRALLDELYKSLKEFLPRDLMYVSAQNTAMVDLRTARQQLVLRKEADGTWRYVTPSYGEADLDGEPAAAQVPPGREPKPITGVRDLVDAIGALRLDTAEDYVVVDASDADLVRYGVADRPDTLRIEVQRTSDSLLGGDPKTTPVTDTLLIGKRLEPEKPTAEIPTRYYVRLEGDRAIAQVAASAIAPLLQVADHPAVLRNRDLVQLDPARTDALDIESAGVRFQLRRAGTPPTWKIFREGLSPAEAFTPAVHELLDALNAKRQIKDFPKPDADYGFDKPAVVLTATASRERQRPEDARPELTEPKLKDQTPRVKLTFGKKDKGLVYVKREAGNDLTIVAVPARLLDKVSQGPLAYLDRILPSFLEEDAVQLLLERGKEVYQVTKDEKSGAWKLQQPKELAGQNADASKVEQILGELKRLRAVRLVAEKADDLAPYGLKPAGVQAAVTLKKDGKKMLYLFGKESDDKSGIYAKQGERGLVFVTEPRELEATLHGALEDLSVLRFHKLKVKELKVSWQAPGRKPVLLHLTRVPGNPWEVKAPAQGFELDPLSAEGFLSRLTTLEARTIVSRQTGPADHHRLDEPRRALHVEIRLEGPTTPPLTLSLGDFDAAAQGYFAQSSSRPGDVFLLPQKPFDDLLKSGLKYFQKSAGGK